MSGADLDHVMNPKPRHLKIGFSFSNDQKIPSSLWGGVVVYPGVSTVAFPVFLVAGGGLLSDC